MAEHFFIIVAGKPAVLPQDQDLAAVVEQFNQLVKDLAETKKQISQIIHK